MIRPIVKYGTTVLHEPAGLVETITGDVGDIVNDMIQTMYAAPGVGLAAPQVGLPLRIFVVDISVGRRPNELMTFINPEFVSRDGMQLEEEGCLSLPGFAGTVARPSKAVVRGLSLEGQEQIIEGEGLLAKAFQHEMDHLEGHVFIDRMRGIQRDLIVRRIKKLTRMGKW
jgi:peptide deformylase